MARGAAKRSWLVGRNGAPTPVGIAAGPRREWQDRPLPIPRNCGNAAALSTGLGLIRQAHCKVCGVVCRLVDGEAGVSVRGNTRGAHTGFAINHHPTWPRKTAAADPTRRGMSVASARPMPSDMLLLAAICIGAVALVLIALDLRDKRS